MSITSVLDDQIIQELNDLRGKKVENLTFTDKCRIMSRIIPEELHKTDLATKLVAMIKPGHNCSKDICNLTCHYHLKGKAFDLLWAYFKEGSV